MISESGGGVFLPVEETGVTRLTDTGTLTGATPLPAMRPDDPASYVRMIVPVFVPRLRAAGAGVTVKVTPAGPRGPEEGVTVSHGLSVPAGDEAGGGCPAAKTRWS